MKKHILALLLSVFVFSLSGFAQRHGGSHYHSKSTSPRPEIWGTFRKIKSLIETGTKIKGAYYCV